MKYAILDNKKNITGFQDFPAYKPSIRYSQMNTEQQIKVANELEGKQYKAFYYYFNAEGFEYVENFESQHLADNCRIATQEDIEAFELNNLREQKKSEVDKIKNELEVLLEYNDVKYDIDTKAQTSFIMYKDLIQKGPLQEPIDWVSADNQNIQLTIQEFLNLINAGLNQLKKIRLNRQPLKELISNMSKEELNALDIKAELLK